MEANLVYRKYAAVRHTARPGPGRIADKPTISTMASLAFATDDALTTSMAGASLEPGTGDAAEPEDDEIVGQWRGQLAILDKRSSEASGKEQWTIAGDGVMKILR